MPELTTVIYVPGLGTVVMDEVAPFVASAGTTKYVAIPAIHTPSCVSKVLERPELSAYSKSL